MDFAADAVLDAVAPARATNCPAPERSADEPKFEHHLDRAIEAEPARGPERSAKPDMAAKSDPVPLEEETASETQTPEPAAPPTVLVQMLVSAPPEAQPTNTDDAAAIAQQTPLAPLTPTRSAPEAPDTAPEAPGDTPTSEAKTAPTQETQEKAAPTATGDAAGAPNTKADTPPANTEQAANRAQTAPPQASAPSSATAQAPIAEMAKQPLMPAPVVDAPQTVRETPSRVSKSDQGRAQAKAEIEQMAPLQATPASPNTTTKPTPGKSAPTTVAPSVDAPAAPPPPTMDAGEATTNAPSGASTQTTSHAQQASLEQASARAAPAAAQVAREIVRRFDGASTRFELRLDPPELGRIDVRLEVSRDHRVTAVIAADNPQALTELVRHARDLEQELQSAGLELGDNGLSFDLRQGGEDAAEAETHETSARGPRAAEDAPQEQTRPAARPIGMERWHGVRVDVMV